MNRFRIALLGSVSFSRKALQALLRNGAHVVGVLGLAEAKSANVSDYTRLSDLATMAGAEYADFTDVNSPEVIDLVRRWAPDYLFVVGLSQLVKSELMAVPNRCAIGFHPTALPKGRGRAPVAWLTYDGADGAATFFVLTQDADAGAIFVQEPFSLSPSDTATETIEHVRAAIDRALDRWLPRFLSGDDQAAPQNEADATYYGKRAAQDGLIDWSGSAADIARLVRTATRPYPGAYTYVRDAKVIVWRASVSTLPYRGVTGRIVGTTASASLLVQSGDGIVEIIEWELVPAPQAKRMPRLTVGVKLGYSPEDEIHSLRQRVADLECRFEELLLSKGD